MITHEGIYVSKLKGIEPEEFVIVVVASDISAIERMGLGLSEGELVATLHKMGITTAAEYRELIEVARRNPVTFEKRS